MKIFQLTDNIPLYDNEGKCFFLEHNNMDIPKPDALGVYLVYGGNPEFFRISLCKDCVKRYPSGKAYILGKL